MPWRKPEVAELLERFVNRGQGHIILVTLSGSRPISRFPEGVLHIDLREGSTDSIESFISLISSQPKQKLSGK